MRRVIRSGGVASPSEAGRAGQLDVVDLCGSALRALGVARGVARGAVDSALPRARRSTFCSALGRAVVRDTCVSEQAELLGESVDAPLLHRGKGVCERERGLAIESSRLRDLRARVATWR